MTVGIFALRLALWRSWVAERQTRISQQGLLQDRYQRGVDLLWNRLMSARLAGIYTLQQLAQEHPDQYHVPVIQQFCGFARDSTKYQAMELEPTYRDITSTDDENWNENPQRLREDVQAVLNVIGYRNKKMKSLEKRNGFTVDLLGADLRGANLDGADLSDANLSDAKLSRARLTRANLATANMQKTDLSCSYEVEAYRTFLDGAKLDDVNLMYSLLSGARLHGATAHQGKVI